MADPSDGRTRIDLPGLSYLPRVITKEESEELIEYFANIVPIWEKRHWRDEHLRSEGHWRRLTRPVYWLGAWQFACLGYYAEPDYREDRCVRAEPLPEVMQTILERLRTHLREAHGEELPAELPGLPNTCLINYFGREVGLGTPRDYARLRMHQDLEPGPVVVFNIGQPGLLEFVHPDRPDEPGPGVWTRHRSVSIFSGDEYKHRLYHRVTRVRSGAEPKLSIRMDNFEVRRISVSFRHVPEELISDFGQLPEVQRGKVLPHVEKLAQTSEHFRAQLET